MILKKEIQINASRCDSTAGLSLIGALQISEDLLTELFHMLHIDGITVRDTYHGLVVYTKNRVKFFSKPYWGMKLQSETFISRITPIRMYVDSILKDEEGNIVYHSKVECCIISMDTMTPMRVVSCGVEKSFAENGLAQELDYDFIDTESCKKQEERRVRSSNIDYIHHTNNIEYLRFAVDTFSIDFFNHHYYDEVQIDYVSQSHENDILEIRRKQEEENRYIFSITLNDKPTINCLMTFSEF